MRSDGCILTLKSGAADDSFELHLTVPFEWTSTSEPNLDLDMVQGATIPVKSRK
jgi:hypothetical protein